MTKIEELESLYGDLLGAPAPSTDLDERMHRLLFPDFQKRSNHAPGYTASVDACILAIRGRMPGWSYRVMECSVSDDAWVIPDFNDPTHGERLRNALPAAAMGDPVEHLGTDIDRRPSGQPALALCMAIVAAHIAVAEEPEIEGAPAI